MGEKKTNNNRKALTPYIYTFFKSVGLIHQSDFLFRHYDHVVCVCVCRFCFFFFTSLILLLLLFLLICCCYCCCSILFYSIWSFYNEREKKKKRVLFIPVHELFLLLLLSFVFRTRDREKKEIVNMNMCLMCEFGEFVISFNKNYPCALWLCGLPKVINKMCQIQIHFKYSP